MFAAPMLRSNIPQVGFQYNTRQFGANGISNSYNAVNDGNNNYAGANFVNSPSQFYGQPQQQQSFYQGQNNAAVFAASSNNMYPNSVSMDRNFNGQNMAATKKSMVPHPSNVGASSASKYPAGFDIMSVSNKSIAKSKIGEPHNNDIVKKTNIPLRPSNSNDENVNSYKKATISKYGGASQHSKVDTTATTSNKKNRITPNFKETIKEKDRIMSEINVEPLSEFQPDNDQDSTARVEKNSIPRPGDFEAERHEMVAKDSIYDIPNSHPIEPLGGNEGGLHSFFPG